jgi:hypothetical protein
MEIAVVDVEIVCRLPALIMLLAGSLTLFGHKQGGHTLSF